MTVPAASRAAVGRGAETFEGHQQQAAGEAGRGIDLLAQDQRHLVGQHVADHPAGGAGHHAHQRRAEKAELKVEGLVVPMTTKVPSPTASRTSSTALPRGNGCGWQTPPAPRQSRCTDVSSCSENGEVADQQVAQGAAADGCHQAEDQDTKDVHASAHGDPGARGGEGGSTNEIESVKDGQCVSPCGSITIHRAEGNRALRPVCGFSKIMSSCVS